jgi:hypothetical protein
MKSFGRIEQKMKEIGEVAFCDPYAEYNSGWRDAIQWVLGDDEL